MCGVSSRFGQPASGEPAGNGSLLEHVERGAAEPRCAKRRRDGGFVDDAAARGIDEDRVGLHRADTRGIEKIARGGHERHVKRQHVGLRKHRVQRARLDAARRSTRGRWAGSCASNPIARMPSARPSRAVSRPMPPKPTMPSVLPRARGRSDSAERGHFAAATSAVEP